MPALVLLWLFAATMHPAAAQQNGITPLQVAQIQTASNPHLTEDGRHVVFTRSIPVDPREANETNSTELFVYDLESGTERSLYSESRFSGLALRPQSDAVTFLARRDGDDRTSLYQIALSGGVPEMIYSFDRSISAYRWAPDGDRIVFIANEELESMASSLPYQPELFEETFANRQAYVVSVTQGDVRQLSADGSFYIMAWSPDGRRIAASVAPDASVDASYMLQRVHVFDAASGEVVARIDNEGKLGDIVWSPDGSQLALLAADHINDPIAGRIMTVPSSGGSPTNILPDFEGKFESIDWTPDGVIHYLASEGAERSFGTIRSDGTDMNRIVEPGGRVITSFSTPRHGQVAMTAMAPEHPNEVFILRAGSGEPQRLTNSNPWLDGVAMGRQEVIEYPTRDDAYQVEGILIYPVDYVEGTSVPLITVVHGGPESHYTNGWLTGYSSPGQMAAANGYAVFYPNYRGSTGRGIEFAMSSQADLAGAEFDDVVDGVDYLIARGVADGDRVGVTGGSYGGYATAWMSTRYSERFAAGVMFVGISNNISKWGTSDIPEELYHVHARERVWDHWQKHLERSPIYWVENAQTPLLIMHGSQDTRVHPAQSLELYRHIKVRRPDVPLRLVFYPGEGHGNARASSRYDYSLRMLQWFDTYLQGDGAEMPSGRIEIEQGAFGTAAR